MSSDKFAEIKKQVEYYFSDKNLEHDSFFHNKISSDKEGWVDIESILNCNKIKSLTEDKDDIEQALQDSKVVEVDKGIFLFFIFIYLLSFRRNSKNWKQASSTIKNERQKE